MCWLETVKRRQSSSAGGAKGYLVCLDKIRRASDEMLACSGTVSDLFGSRRCSIVLLYWFVWAAGFSLADCLKMESSIYHLVHCDNNWGRGCLLPFFTFPAVGGMCSPLRDKSINLNTFSLPLCSFFCLSGCRDWLVFTAHSALPASTKQKAHKVLELMSFNVLINLPSPVNAAASRSWNLIFGS